MSEQSVVAIVAALITATASILAAWIATRTRNNEAQRPIEGILVAVGLAGFRRLTKRLSDRSGWSLVSSACGLSVGLLAAALVSYVAAFVVVAAIPFSEFSWWVHIWLPVWPSFIFAFLFVLSVLNFIIVAKKTFG
jgi:hypothetical protein